MTNPFADTYDGRRVLVTGHTGFKGAWLSLWLELLGADVTGYSDKVPTSPSAFELLRLETRIDHRLGDILDRSRLAKVLDEVKPDIVFHLAAQAIVLQSHIDPVGTFATNTMGTVNLLESIRERPWIKTVVIVTSDKVYRNDECGRSYQESDYLGGHDPYSSSKSCAELVTHSYHHSFLRDSPTRTATARSGNVIGGGDWADNRIVPDCIRAWSSGEIVSVRRPESTRPWQHVLEPLSGYLWLGANLWNDWKNLDGEAFNFGPQPQEDITVVDLMETMARQWPGAVWEVTGDRSRTGQEASHLRLSCDKALRQLNWHSILQFPAAATLTIDWYHAWQRGDVDLYDYTITQLERYTNLGRSAGVAWCSD